MDSSYSLYRVFLRCGFIGIITSMGYWYIAFVSYIQTLMKIYFFNSTPCKVRSLPISSGKYGCNAQILSIQGIRRFKSSLHQGPLLQLSEESEGCFLFWKIQTPDFFMIMEKSGEIVAVRGFEINTRSAKNLKH